jgi:hypothetical protein
VEVNATNKTVGSGVPGAGSGSVMHGRNRRLVRGSDPEAAEPTLGLQLASRSIALNPVASNPSQAPPRQVAAAVCTTPSLTVLTLTGSLFYVVWVQPWAQLLPGRRRRAQSYGAPVITAEAKALEDRTFPHSRQRMPSSSFIPRRPLLRAHEDGGAATAGSEGQSTVARGTLLAELRGLSLQYVHRTHVVSSPRPVSVTVRHRRLTT